MNDYYYEIDPLLLAVVVVVVVYDVLLLDEVSRLRSDRYSVS